MRTLRICVMFLALISILATIGVKFLNRDKDGAPVLNCLVSEDVIEVTCDVTDEELAKLVTATDTKDGDISDRVAVTRNMYFITKGVSAVTFSVCDSDNNVTKLYKSIKYTDYEAPRLYLKSDLIISQGNPISLPRFFRVEDVFAGDISNRLKVMSADYDYLTEGTYTINCKVSNNYGDTREMDFDVIVTEDDYSDAKITLSEYLVYVKKGETPDFASYIKNVINNDDKYNFTTADVRIEAEGYDSSKAGLYSVFYNITSGGRTVTRTRLIVIVEEE